MPVVTSATVGHGEPSTTTTTLRLSGWVHAFAVERCLFLAPSGGRDPWPMATAPAILAEHTKLRGGETVSAEVSEVLVACRGARGLVKTGKKETRMITHSLWPPKQRTGPRL